MNLEYLSQKCACKVRTERQCSYIKFTFFWHKSHWSLCISASMHFIASLACRWVPSERWKTFICYISAAITLLLAEATNWCLDLRSQEPAGGLKPVFLCLITIRHRVFCHLVIYCSTSSRTWTDWFSAKPRCPVSIRLHFGWMRWTVMKKSISQTYRFLTTLLNLIFI